MSASITQWAMIKFRPLL